MTTTELRRLWNEKVTRDVPLTKEEKDAFVSAYWDGTLPRIEGINQIQAKPQIGAGAGKFFGCGRVQAHAPYIGQR